MASSGGSPGLVLSLLLPAYNEADGIRNAVEQNVAAARKLGIPFEVVAIDDGSRDATHQQLERLAAEFEELLLVRHPFNRGFGEAICSGIRTARAEFCLLSPVDSPHSTATLRTFLEASRGADVVLGYRSYKAGYTWQMRFNSQVYHTLLRLTCGLPYRDVNWIHLYRRKIFERIDVEFGGIVMAAEIVLKARALRLQILEVACDMRPRLQGVASARRFSVMARTGRDVLRLLWQWHFGSMRSRLGQGLLQTDA